MKVEGMTSRRRNGRGKKRKLPVLTRHNGMVLKRPTGKEKA